MMEGVMAVLLIGQILGSAKQSLEVAPTSVSPAHIPGTLISS